VTGSRYGAEGGVEGWSFMRKLTSRTANFVTKFALGVDCSDFTGSFRLYRR
jgi:dolichol-phosphate mannosyltransferase